MLFTGLMPVLIKELRTQLRGSRAALLITLYVGLALIAMRLIYNSVAGQIGVGPPIFSAQIGQSIFIGLALAVQTLTIFLAPATTINSISSEYERRTYEMLQATPLTATQLLVGKLLSGVAFTVLMLFAALPLFSIIVLFGGVGIADIVRVVAVVLATAVAGGALGLLCSAITRQTYSATLLCYALLVALIGGTLLVANLWTQTNGNAPAPPNYVFTNPLTAIASALGRTRPPEIVSSETLRPLVLLSLLSQGTVTIEAGERVVLPMYRATLVVYGALTIGFIWICLHLLQPKGQRRLVRTDAVFLAVALAYSLIVSLARPWWLAGLAL
ncbi:MAG: ABC transporter permease subunit [Oscillochloris sp.]|nr:ABC transporter permease subunit [Oscillochloris sp.]